MKQKFLLVSLALIAIGIPLTVSLNGRSQQQILQSKAAANPTAPVFPYGVFEDGNRQSSTTFPLLINDLKPKGFNTVLFVNNTNATQLPLLDISDQMGFNVVWGGPIRELSCDWYGDPAQPSCTGAQAPADISHARTILGPLVDAVKTHPSVIGYNLNDDSVSSLKTKINLAAQVYNERDVTRSAMATIVGANEDVYTPEQHTFLTYYYPAKLPNQPCDWDFISPTQNQFSQTIRSVTRYKDDDNPLWLILQTHGAHASVLPLGTQFTGHDGKIATSSAVSLRDPTKEEVRLQNWMGVGEGAKGIFWFVYTTQQFWTGLKDSPALLAETSSLAQRTKQISPILLSARKVADRFNLAGTDNRYISTLSDGTKYFAVAANASCTSPQQVQITSSSLSGNLKDTETGQTYAFNQAITLQPGDGKVFEVTNATINPLPTPTLSPNLLPNPSFETNNNGSPAVWQARSSTAWDTAQKHTGNASMRLGNSAANNTYTFAVLANGVAWKPGTLYTLSFWAKTNQVMGTGVSMRASNAFDMPWVNGTTDWKHVKQTFYTPLDYQSGRVDIQWTLKAGETAWIDDVLLCEGQDCNEPHVSPTPTGVVSPTTPALKLGDVDRNGVVNILDYTLLFEAYGTRTGNTKFDVRADFVGGTGGAADGIINILDYTALFENYGT